MEAIMKATQAYSRVEFKNILFTTDFSPAAAGAIPFTKELVERYGATLYALHVRPPVIDPMTPGTAMRAFEVAARIGDEKHRKELASTFEGVGSEILIEEGDLWSNLAATLEKNDIDLIVMGTRGRSGIRRFLLGSAAEEVFRRAPCPVLTVGPHSLSGPKEGGEFSHILFATDFSPESLAAAPYAVSLAEEYEAHITLLHVIAEPKAGDLVRPPELEASSMHLLRKLIPAEAELWCVPKFAVERGAPAEKILDVAARSKADLIVLGVRQPSGFPGAATHLPIAVAHDVISQAVCPVLTVRG